MTFTDSQQTSLILRTPLKGKRILLGCGLIAIGLAIFNTFSMNGTAWTWATCLVVFLPVCTGLGFAGLDYVTRIESEEPAVYSGWQFFSLRIGTQRYRNLLGLDRIVIARRQLPVTSPRGGGVTLRPVYPVWLMSKTAFLDYLLGWSPEYLERVSSGKFLMSRPPNFSVFRVWARYVAAQTALRLNVPLVDEKTGVSYRPDDIPPEWLQREGLSFDSYHEKD